MLSRRMPETRLQRAKWYYDLGVAFQYPAYALEQQQGHERERKPRQLSSAAAAMSVVC